MHKLAQAVVECDITPDTAQEIAPDAGDKVPSKNSKELMIMMTEEDLQGNEVISANIDLQLNEANDVEQKEKDGKEVEDTDCDTSNNKQQFVGMKEVASENGNVLKTRNLLDRKNTKEGVNNVDDKQQNLKCEAESNFVENQRRNEKPISTNIDLQANKADKEHKKGDNQQAENTDSDPS